MVNKISKEFDLSFILNQIEIPMTASEKSSISANLNNVLESAYKRIDASRGRSDYSSDEVRAHKVPYASLLKTDANLAMGDVMQDLSDEDGDFAHAFEQSFNKFASYRRLNSYYHLYSDLAFGECDKILDDVKGGIVSKYKLTPDQSKSIVPAIKKVALGFFKSDIYTDMKGMGLI